MYSQLRSAVSKARATSTNMSESRSRAQVNPVASFSTDNLIVDHDTRRKQFFIELDRGNAFISYNRSGDVMHLEHTEVPQALSGRGIGKVLAKVHSFAN